MSKIKKYYNNTSSYFITCVIALVLVLGIGNSNKENTQVANETDIPIEQTEIGLKPVEKREDYYIIKDSVGKYYSYYAIIFNAGSYYSTQDEQIIAQAEKDNAQILYNMLDTDILKLKALQQII